MKRAIIFSNGDLSDLKKLKKLIKKSDVVIAADGGAKIVLTLGVVPDLVVGDLDSIDKKTLNQLKKQQVAIINYPTDKDETDTELAIESAIKQGVEEVILSGILGRRMDHLISNLMGLVSLVERGVKVSLVEGKQRGYLVKDRLAIEARKDDLVSLIPLSGDCRGVKTQGLKYRLSGETLFFGKSRGVSNVMLKDKAAVSLTKGILLVVVGDLL